MVGTDAQPISHLLWLPREALYANDYNPNVVAPVELRLLELSIAADGWTQPIVAREAKDGYEIVDGFHRHLISERPRLAEMTDGMVPVVLTRNVGEDERRLSTIRHNRARGTHTVIRMAEIVADLTAMGVEPDDLIPLLGMEREEVSRLAERGNMLKRAAADEFGEAWSPAESVRQEAT